MDEEDDWKPPTHRDAIREAWWEFKEGVSFQAFCLQQNEDERDRNLPSPVAWLCAIWVVLLYRFTPYNLERLFRPQKAERRQRVADLCDFVFWWGADEMTEELWAEADALVAEFKVPFPPRDWKPMSVAEAVGQRMGYTREEVADILAKPW